MLNEILKESINQQGANIMNIYRHFKGGYYVVQATATVEATGEQVVVYQSLQDGRIWTRPLSVFQELVPEGKENPTGQKYRFERVTKFNNQLNLIPTEQLMKELLSRDDCPSELQSLNPEKVWREEYAVGRYENHFVDEDNTVVDFDVHTVHNSFEEAVSKVKKSNNPFASILKVVYIKQDFD